MTASGTAKEPVMSSPAIAPEAHSPSKKAAPHGQSSPEKPAKALQQAHHNQTQSQPPPKHSVSLASPQQQQPQQQPQQHHSGQRATSAKPGAAASGDGDVVGEYVLGETIGQGTFGKVKLGLHLVTGEKVAIKILEKKRIVQVADVERVAREIKILKRNRHLNVIQLYEVIDSPERIYLIMEHVDSGEMFEYIVAHRRIREQDAVVFFQQIVDGLSYLHANEVTHRDLKPENLLLQSHSAGFLVKIVDFGLSNTHDNGRLLRTACGSPCYAAPEMIEGKLYKGPVADIWSLGVVLFAMVCGYLPFEDSNTNMLYKKILSADYKLPPFLSHDLIRRILETNPEKRFTIDMIRQHPWFTSMRAVLPKTLTEREDAAIREMIFNQLDALGMDKTEVLDALQKKAHNHLTASYYLLHSKLVRILKDRNSSCSGGHGESSHASSTLPPRTTGVGIQPKRLDHIDDSRPGKSKVNSPRPSAAASPQIQVTKKVESVGAMAVSSQSDPHGQSPHADSARLHTTQPSPVPQSRENHHPSVRAATPSGASPRHPSNPVQQSPGVSASSAVVLASSQPRRPSSVRSGRNLVILANGSSYHPVAAVVSTANGVTPAPPRDRRPSGPMAPKASGGVGIIPSGSAATSVSVASASRVSVSNGMVALTPLAHPHRKDSAGSSASRVPATRRHTLEVSHHVPSRHPASIVTQHSPYTSRSDAGAAASTHSSGESSSNVGRRRISINQAASPNAFRTTTTQVTTAAPRHHPHAPAAASHQKEDDARAPQSSDMRIQPPPQTHHHTVQPPSSSRPPTFAAII